MVSSLSKKTYVRIAPVQSGETCFGTSDEARGIDSLEEAESQPESRQKFRCFVTPAKW
jgi:hypothetical protein